MNTSAIFYLRKIHDRASCRGGAVNDVCLLVWMNSVAALVGGGAPESGRCHRLRRGGRSTGAKSAAEPVTEKRAYRHDHYAAATGGEPKIMGHEASFRGE